MGALSLLQLIDGIEAVTLVGQAKKWVHAYSSLVEKISGFLFGWMRWRWFHISEVEAHLLVLVLLLLAAVSRASFKTGRMRSRAEAIRSAPRRPTWLGLLALHLGQSIGILIGMFAAFLAMAILPIGVYVVALFLVVWIAALVDALIRWQGPMEPVYARAVLSELTIVGVVAAALVLFSHALETWPLG
jgi:hypothetical protein